MKKTLTLLALITQVLFTINAQPIITVLSPTQGDLLTIGSTRTINVVIQSSVQTNVWIWINGLGNGYSLASGWLAMNQSLPIGTSTNTYTVPSGIFGGDGFSITVAIEDDNPYPGRINPYAESSEFAITDLPTITVSPSTNEVWRPGEVRNLTYTWHNMHVGDINAIWLGWNEGSISPPGGEAYGFKLCSGIFTTEQGTNTVQITVPSGVAAGKHFIRIVNESNWANNFASGLVYMGTSNAPTVAKITGIDVQQPVGDSEGLVTLYCEGLPNWDYFIQETTNMVNWETVSSAPITSPSGSFYFQRNITNTISRFYRMLQVPQLVVGYTVSPTSPKTYDQVTWTAVVSGGTGTYQYLWTSIDGTTGQNPYTEGYGNGGVKTLSLSVTSGNQTVVIPCSVTVTEP